MVALTVACGGGDGGDSRSSGGNRLVTVATVTPAPPTTPTPTLDQVLRGFIYPIDGGCLPQGDQLMPNAPREYRLGVHEGVDNYAVDSCVDITVGTPARAAKAGTVIRIDHDYVYPTGAQMDALLSDPDNEKALDAFRGRQVWIDHGGGVVTRYCHLSAVVDTLQVGDHVDQGATVGFVGESGTPEHITNPGTEYHLHWEVRIGDSFLGKGEPPEQVRSEYLSLFNP
jgi:murein DD-endopeptidase MepM/ murein hydrolase activator NlpD